MFQKKKRRKSVHNTRTVKFCFSFCLVVDLNDGKNFVWNLKEKKMWTLKRRIWLHKASWKGETRWQKKSLKAIHTEWVRSSRINVDISIAVDFSTKTHEITILPHRTDNEQGKKRTSFFFFRFVLYPSPALIYFKLTNTPNWFSNKEKKNFFLIKSQTFRIFFCFFFWRQ